MIALGQRRLKVCVEQRMAYPAQKDKELPRLLCPCGNLLLFRAQRDWRVPHGSTPHGGGYTVLLSPSEHRCPSLSTLYEPLSKQLVSVLAVAALSLSVLLLVGIGAWYALHG